MTTSPSSIPEAAVEAAARRTDLVSVLVAAIEDIITDQTGRNVLRSGWDGSFTANGGTVARMIDAALEAAAPFMLAEAWDAGEEAGQDNADSNRGFDIEHKRNPYEATP